MDKDRDNMAERILGLTLEIIHLLTGEDYTVVKKTDESVASSSRRRESGGWSKSQIPRMVPPPSTLIHGRSNELQILELISKILQVVTGEVPVRCQDVTVYLSVEEWEYMEGHKDQYKDVLMEDPRPLTPPGGSSKSHSPDRCGSPQDGNQDVSEHHQNDDLIIVKVEDPDQEDDEADSPEEEETPTAISTGSWLFHTLSSEYCSAICVAGRPCLQTSLRDSDLGPYRIQRGRRRLMCYNRRTITEPIIQK